MIHPKIIDLIIYFLSELKTNNRISDEVLLPLTESGYTQSDINFALEWVFSDKIAENRSNDNFRSKRFLSKDEEKIISPEAFGFLIRLHELAILTHADVNLILDTIMISEISARLGIEELKLIVSEFLMKGRRFKGNFRELLIIN